MQRLINEAYAKLERRDESKTKLEAPTKFSGDKDELPSFLTMIQVYLRYYPEKFKDEEAKIYFVASRLEGKALQWFEPTLKDRMTEEEENQEDFTKNVFKNYATFEKELEKVFGDTDRKLHV
ncbi:hypothetical protein P885DRAFT_48225 [Corynascus similis CBS 632.67]